MYGLEYIVANDDTTLKNGLKQLHAQNNQAVIIEVFTPTLQNDAVLKQFFKELV